MFMIPIECNTKLIKTLDLKINPKSNLYKLLILWFTYQQKNIDSDIDTVWFYSPPIQDICVFVDTSKQSIDNGLIPMEYLSNCRDLMAFYDLILLYKNEKQNPIIIKPKGKTYSVPLEVQMFVQEIQLVKPLSHILTFLNKKYRENIVNKTTNNATKYHLLHEYINSRNICCYRHLTFTLQANNEIVCGILHHFNCDYNISQCYNRIRDWYRCEP